MSFDSPLNHPLLSMIEQGGEWTILRNGSDPARQPHAARRVQIKPPTLTNG
jgi:hypothetical protein